MSFQPPHSGRVAKMLGPRANWSPRQLKMSLQPYHAALVAAWPMSRRLAQRDSHEPARRREAGARVAGVGPRDIDRCRAER